MTLVRGEKPVLRRPVMMLMVAAVGLLAVALLTSLFPFRQIVAQRQEIIATQARLDALVAENDLLSEQVEALGTPLEVERLARERLGYVRPGESSFVVIEPENPPAVYPEDGLTAELAERPTWLQRLWAFLTGADLATG